MVYLPHLRGAGFYMQYPKKDVHAHSPCWVFLEYGIFPGCEMKPCLNVAKKECLGELTGL